LSHGEFRRRVNQVCPALISAAALAYWNRLLLSLDLQRLNRALFPFSSFALLPSLPSVDCDRAFCAALLELTRSFSGAEKEEGGCGG